MPAARSVEATAPKIAHEEFCLPPSARDPQSEYKEPRVESFLASRLDSAGRELGAVRVWRCIECGAARYVNE